MHSPVCLNFWVIPSLSRGRKRTDFVVKVSGEVKRKKKRKEKTRARGNGIGMQFTPSVPYKRRLGQTIRSGAIAPVASSTRIHYQRREVLDYLLKAPSIPLLNPKRSVHDGERTTNSVKWRFAESFFDLLLLLLLHFWKFIVTIER